MDEMNLTVDIKSVDIISISKIDVSDNVAMYSIETNARWPASNTILYRNGMVQVCIFDSAAAQIEERTTVSFHLPEEFKLIEDSVEFICRARPEKWSINVLIAIQDNNVKFEPVWPKECED